MEAAQQKSKRAKLVIHDKYMHAVAIKLLLQSGDYETKTREWSKLPEEQQTWATWKTTFREAYVAKRRDEAAQEEGKKLLVFLPYSELHLKRKQTNHYGGENIKKQRGQPRSQIK